MNQPFNRQLERSKSTDWKTPILRRERPKRDIRKLLTKTEYGSLAAMGHTEITWLFHQIPQLRGVELRNRALQVDEYFVLVQTLGDGGKFGEQVLALLKIDNAFRSRADELPGSDNLDCPCHICLDEFLRA